MTALEQYDRLEATGLWRETKTSQNIEVLVSFGNASLILSDFTGNPLTHWSLPAVTRLNKGKTPAIYSPNSYGIETLEIDDETMVIAIEQVRKTIKSRRPRKGRLRILTFVTTLLVISLLAIFWLPNILIQHTSSLVYAEQRKQIGFQLIDHISKFIGPHCVTDSEINPLLQLESRLFPNSDIRIYVFSGGIKSAIHLPGRFILLNQFIVEDFETPDVVAGFSIIEKIKMDRHDPIEQLLSYAGTRAVLRFLTTGRLNQITLEQYARYILSLEPITLETELIISEFESRDVNLAPYAYAIDITGESTSELIEHNKSFENRQILTKQEWLNLQSICEG